ncbi:hypothetical protein JB92DRAFT_2835934 [Gautieria morchelliformis]|nr:hypothetical protein JB92DRAFT_2835934 [Gautieria morchelliformis]
MASLSRLMNRDAQPTDMFRNSVNTPPARESFLHQLQSDSPFVPGFPSSDDASDLTYLRAPVSGRADTRKRPHPIAFGFEESLDENTFNVPSMGSRPPGQLAVRPGASGGLPKPVTANEVDAIANERKLTKVLRTELHSFAKCGMPLSPADLRLRLVLFAEDLSQRQLLNTLVEDQKAIKTLLAAVDSKIKAKAVLEGHVKFYQLTPLSTRNGLRLLCEIALSEEGRTNYVNVWQDAMVAFEAKSPELKYEYFFRDVNLRKLVQTEMRKRSTTQREQLRRLHFAKARAQHQRWCHVVDQWSPFTDTTQCARSMCDTGMYLASELQEAHIRMKQRTYTIKHMGGVPTGNTTQALEGTADADEDADEEDLDVDADPAPKAKKAKPSKQGETVDVKFWRGVEAEVLAVNQKYAKNMEGYKASSYIEKLIHEDHGQFGKKQSAAHALLLACRPSPPPAPIGSDAQLPEGSAATGVLENEYGANSYERAGSVAAAPRGYREFQS